VRYGYDDRGNLGYKEEQDVTTRYFYDLINRLREVRTSDGWMSEFDLDKNSNLLTLTETLGGAGYVTEHEYDMDNRLTLTGDEHRSQRVVYNAVTGMLESVTLMN
jgi:YD repeat-containing protein